MEILKSILVFIVFLTTFMQCHDEWVEPEDKIITRAVVESCSGCRLNKLLDLKKFIFEDLPYFHNVEFKKVGGAPPVLILLNKNDEEIERIPMEVYDREDCNNLLQSLGFYKKKTKDEKVPEEYLHGPYIPKDEL